MIHSSATIRKYIVKRESAFSLGRYPFKEKYRYAGKQIENIFRGVKMEKRMYAPLRVGSRQIATSHMREQTTIPFVFPMTDNSAKKHIKKKTITVTKPIVLSAKQRKA